MRIGIDLDGVVFNSEMFFMAAGEFFDCAVLKRNSIIKKEEPRVQSKYDWTQEEVDEYVRRYALSDEFDVMPFASKVINLLKAAGNEIYVISARGQFYEEELEIAKTKLAEANISADKYFWGHLDKTKICEDEKIDIMIEDRYDVCEILSARNIKCLYFRMAGRKVLQESDNLHEVNNWGEVYRRLYEMGGI